jgi:hypothetical protein
LGAIGAATYVVGKVWDKVFDEGEKKGEAKEKDKERRHEHTHVLRHGEGRHRYGDDHRDTGWYRRDWYGPAIEEPGQLEPRGRRVYNDAAYGGASAAPRRYIEGGREIYIEDGRRHV